MTTTTRSQETKPKYINTQAQIFVTARALGLISPSDDLDIIFTRQQVAGNTLFLVQACLVRYGLHVDSPMFEVLKTGSTFAYNHGDAQEQLLATLELELGGLRSGDTVYNLRLSRHHPRDYDFHTGGHSSTGARRTGRFAVSYRRGRLTLEIGRRGNMEHSYHPRSAFTPMTWLKQKLFKTSETQVPVLRRSSIAKEST